MATESKELALLEAVQVLKDKLYEQIDRDEISPNDLDTLNRVIEALDGYIHNLNPNDLETALSLLIKGSKWQALYSTMLAFFVSFLSFSGVNSLVPQLPISYTLKFILLNLSAITAMISRLNQGIKASDNGGCQQLITYLELSLVGLVFTTACSILTSPEWVGDLKLNSYVIFSIEAVASILAGYGFASVSILPNAIAWFSKNDSGIPASCIPGPGGITPGIVDLITANITTKSGLNIYLLTSSVILLSSILVLQNKSFGLLTTPYQQLRTYGLDRNTSILLAEKFGQEFFPNKISWVDYQKLLKSSSSWLHTSNYVVFLGLFVGWTSSLRVILPYWDYSFATARLYSASFVIVSSIMRTLAGVPLKYFGLGYVSNLDHETLDHSLLDNDQTYGAYVNMAGAFIVAVCCLVLANIPRKSLSNAATFTPILLGIATGVALGCAATLKRITRDPLVNKYAANSLTASFGPMGAFIILVNSLTFALFFSNQGIANQKSFNMYAPLTLAMGAAYLYWGPRAENEVNHADLKHELDTNQTSSKVTELKPLSTTDINSDIEAVKPCIT